MAAPSHRLAVLLGIRALLSVLSVREGGQAVSSRTAISMNSKTFIATVEGDTIYAIDSSSRERAEVGITQKSVKAMQEALTNAIAKQRKPKWWKCLPKALQRKSVNLIPCVTSNIGQRKLRPRRLYELF